jgi:hypothetical protein
MQSTEETCGTSVDAYVPIPSDGINQLALQRFPNGDIVLRYIVATYLYGEGNLPELVPVQDLSQASTVMNHKANKYPSMIVRVLDVTDSKIVAWTRR